MGPKTRTRTDLESVLPLFSTDLPSKCVGLRICPNLIGTGSSLIYQISYLFLIETNPKSVRVGVKTIRLGLEIWTRTGTDLELVPVSSVR